MDSVTLRKTNFKLGDYQNPYSTTSLEQSKALLAQGSQPAQLDEDVKTRFKDTFNTIADSFKQIFPVVFGGGKAKLELTEPNNLLETGIEIIAQPPGKKLQRLSLLSGGERALTAITLLFAMLQVNPVPFCVLDEVEAALDDANVTRFAQFLLKYDMKTQFIVITHRKPTMRHADTIFGVAMEEKGVTKIVSIEFDEAVKHASDAQSAS